MIAFRNILVHGYSAIDYATVALIEDRLLEYEQEIDKIAIV